jgi:hypothetical protein
MTQMTNEAEKETIGVTQTDPAPGKREASTNPWLDAIGAGALAGAFAGAVAHTYTGGQLTFPLFMVVTLVLLGNLKGWTKVVGLFVFAFVAALTTAVFRLLAS